MLGLLFVWLIVLQIATALFCSKLIGEKGYDDKDSWFWGGLIFGVIALIAAAGMPDLEETEK